MSYIRFARGVRQMGGFAGGTSRLARPPAVLEEPDVRPPPAAVVDVAYSTLTSSESGPPTGWSLPGVEGDLVTVHAAVWAFEAGAWDVTVSFKDWDTFTEVDIPLTFIADAAGLGDPPSLDAGSPVHGAWYGTHPGAPYNTVAVDVAETSPAAPEAFQQAAAVAVAGGSGMPTADVAAEYVGSEIAQSSAGALAVTSVMVDGATNPDIDYTAAVAHVIGSAFTNFGALSLHFWVTSQVDFTLEASDPDAMSLVMTSSGG